MDTGRSNIKSPGQNERDRKAEQQQHDDETQRPIGQFPRREDRRSKLDNAAGYDDVSDRDAVNLAPAQLLEKGHAQSIRSLPKERKRWP